jgi:hypothetical protein
MSEAIIIALISAAATILAAWIAARRRHHPDPDTVTRPQEDPRPSTDVDRPGGEAVDERAPGPRQRPHAAPVTSPARIPADGTVAGALVADRQAFLDEVCRIAGPAARTDYARVIDDLIAWSESRSDSIEFRPRPTCNTQATVTYCFRGTEHIFWQVYPRPSERDAKFCSVSDPRWLIPVEVRDRLRRQFATLSGGQEDSPVIPTLSFRDLTAPAARCIGSAVPSG